MRGGHRLWGLSSADFLVIAGFLVAAILYFLGRWQGISPFAFLDGDGANLSSFSVARADSGGFADDALLSRGADTGFYVNFHTVWTNTVGRVIDDFGLAYLMLLVPVLFLHLSLFYALGRSLFDSRLGALLLALLGVITIILPLGEYWGVHADPHPRALFSAFLPLALLMVVRWRDRPELWPLPMALLGILTYVHPVSAPPVAGAVWVGLAALYRPEIGLRHHLVALAVAAGTFLLIMAPFALLYFGSTDVPLDPQLTQAARLAMAERFSRGFMDVPLAFWLSINTWTNLRIVLPAAAAASAWFLWTKRPQTRRPLLFFVAMGVGLLVCGFGLPLVDQLLAQASNRLPHLVDFLRAIRYVVMVMLVVAVWGGVEALRGRGRIERLGLAAACLLLPLAWATVNKAPVLQIGQRLAGCAVQGRLLCGPNPAEADRLALLRYLKEETPQAAVVVSLAEGDDALDVRYVAERPLAFSWKDGGAFAYSNPTALLAWRDQWRTFQPLQGSAPAWAQVSAFATDVGADHVILDAEDASAAPTAALCFRNRRYAVAVVDGTCAS